jgi:cytochrome oxidase Cu insertion factor (SCO1/SenC/PrrC family)
VQPDRVIFSLLLILPIWFGSCPAWAEDGIGGDFSLTDQAGQPFRLAQLRGKVVLLFFGYTFCPDICPTELANLSAVLNELPHAGDQVQGVFVTVDPERDTPRVLADYVGYFSRHLIGLTGSPDQIAQVAEKYRVKYRKNPRPGGAYSVDHSVNLYVIDRAGELATVIPYGLPPEHVLEVVRRLLSGGS